LLTRTYYQQEKKVRIDLISDKRETAMRSNYTTRRKVIELFKSAEAEETYKTESKTSLNGIVKQLEMMKLRYEKEKLHKEKLLLERKVLKSELKTTKATWDKIESSFIVRQPMKKPYLYPSVEEYRQYFMRENIEQKQAALWIDEMNQYRPVLTTEYEPRSQMEGILKRESVVDLGIRDIILISFLYLGGLLFIGIGLMKPDIFYAALGALGIIGSTFHWMKEQSTFD
jgi:hypothetical protein